MIKVKDGYAKLVGTTASGSASHILLSNGGIKAVSDFAAASALDNYLPLSGGILTSSGNPLIIKRTDDSGPGLVFYSKETQLGSIGISTDYVPKFYNANVGTLYTMWHSGNDGSGSGLDADLLDGLHGSWYQNHVHSFDIVNISALNSAGASTNVNTLRYGMLYNYGSSGYWVNAPVGMLYGLILNLKNSNTYDLAGQLAWDINHNSTTDTTRYLWWRATDDGTFTEAKWHRIAYAEEIPTVTNYYWANVLISSTSNATTKPTFSNTIVNGVLTVNGGMKTLAINHNHTLTTPWNDFIACLNPNLTATYHTAHIAFGRTYDSKNVGYIGFKYAGSASNSNMVTIGLHSVDNILNILASGNVGIGTISPSYKLHVEGDIYATSTNAAISINRTGTYSSEPCIGYYNAGTRLGSIGVKDYNTPFFWNASTSTVYTIWHSGNDGSGSGLDADMLDGKQLSSFITYELTTNYVGASFNSEDLSKKAASTYIEYWDGAGGWFNSRWGLVLAISGFHRVGSSDSYVLLGGGGHKTESSLSVSYAASAGNADTLDNYHASDFAAADRGVYPIRTFTKTLTPTTSWTDTGITTANFADGEGAYLIFLDPNHSNGNDGWVPKYMGYFASMSGTNGSLTEEIILLAASHASYKRLFLRFINTANTLGYRKLQIRSQSNYTTAYNMIFKIRRII